jgi:primosomal protein N' (replication factor Y)
VLLYGSATPSVDLYYRAAKGGCGLVELKERTNRQAMPRVHIADMREEIKNGNRGMFSLALSNALASALSERRQAMLFLNRRGYTSIHLCRSCGYIVSCRDCSVSYTYHRERDRLVCHYCGLTAPVPRVCPACGSGEISGFGAGTERVEHDVLASFPNSRVLRMDRDTTSGKDSYAKILGAFRDGEADILIGTQMIAKGHDFPNVTLVGVLAADSILNFADFRASERTFQLLTQVAGRSGRGEHAGRVIIQTYNPDHFSIITAGNHDYQGFYRQEMIARRALQYPPFMNFGIFILSGRVDARVGEAAERLHGIIVKNAPRGLSVFPPARPPHAKIQERYRWRLIIKHRDISGLEEIARNASGDFYREKKPSGVDLSFDVNPFSML